MTTSKGLCRLDNTELPNQRSNELLHTPDSLAASLKANLLNWQVKRSSDSGVITTKVLPRSIDDIRIIELSGEPFHAVRGQSEIAEDDDDFIGVLYQRSGSTLCRMGEKEAQVDAGDVTIWRCDRPSEFRMLGHYDKLCMMIPVTRLESVLHNATSYHGLHLSSDNSLATLLGSYLSTLSQEIAEEKDCVSFGTVDVTLELLAAALRSNRSKTGYTPRKQLQERIFRFIESRLSDPDLTPKGIAEGNGISVRYLYVLFSEQELTVSAWIRQRRLARCRAALENQHSSKTVTEIAYEWGFSDSAHFSRLFKSAFGLPPAAYKAALRAH